MDRCGGDGVSAREAVLVVLGEGRCRDVHDWRWVGETEPCPACRSWATHIADTLLPVIERLVDEARSTQWRHSDGRSCDVRLGRWQIRGIPDEFGRSRLCERAHDGSDPSDTGAIDD